MDHSLAVLKLSELGRDCKLLNVSYYCGIVLQTCIENSSILVRGAAPENEGNISSAIVTPARMRQKRMKLLKVFGLLYFG